MSKHHNKFQQEWTCWNELLTAHDALIKKTSNCTDYNYNRSDYLSEPSKYWSQEWSKRDEKTCRNQVECLQSICRTVEEAAKQCQATLQRCKQEHKSAEWLQKEWSWYSNCYNDYKNACEKYYDKETNPKIRATLEKTINDCEKCCTPIASLWRELTSKATPAKTTHTTPHLNAYQQNKGYRQETGDSSPYPREAKKESHQTGNSHGTPHQGNAHKSHHEQKSEENKRKHGKK